MTQALSLLVSSGPFKDQPGADVGGMCGEPTQVTCLVLVTLDSGPGDGMKCEGPARGVACLQTRAEPRKFAPGSNSSYSGTWFDGKITWLVLCSVAPSSGL